MDRPPLSVLSAEFKAPAHTRSHAPTSLDKSNDNDNDTTTTTTKKKTNAPRVWRLRRQVPQEEGKLLLQAVRGRLDDPPEADGRARPRELGLGRQRGAAAVGVSSRSCSCLRHSSLLMGAQAHGRVAHGRAPTDADPAATRDALRPLALTYSLVDLRPPQRGRFRRPLPSLFR